MKTTMALILCLINVNLAIAQYETYGAGWTADTVKIWNTNIRTECNAKYTASVTLSRDSIIVTEIDTTRIHANCLCYYDVRVSVSSLQNGNYQVVIYRQQLKRYDYVKDTLIYVASLSVSIPFGSNSAPQTKVFASDCHEIPTSLVNESPTASAFALLTSYPNPFNPKATIHYSLPTSTDVRLDVYDASGRNVATLVSEKQIAGYYDVEFDGSRLSSGVYVCRLSAATIVLTNKIVLLK